MNVVTDRAWRTARSAVAEDRPEPVEIVFALEFMSGLQLSVAHLFDVRAPQ